MQYVFRPGNNATSYGPPLDAMSTVYGRFHGISRAFVVQMSQDVISVYLHWVGLQFWTFRDCSDDAGSDECGQISLVGVVRRTAWAFETPRTFALCLLFLDWAMLTFVENGNVDDGPKASVTDCYVVVEEGDWFLLLGDQKFPCYGLLWLALSTTWESGQDCRALVYKKLVGLFSKQDALWRWTSCTKPQVAKQSIVGRYFRWGGWWLTGIWAVYL